MDLIKTGKFIAELRKSKKLTQQALAEKLGVSEKTISKWECGNGFPDTTLILPLCNELSVTANELLSAKKLDENSYKKNAEENLVELNAKQQCYSKFLLTLEIVLGFICSITFIGLVFLASFCEFPTWLRVILIVFGFLMFCVGIHFCLLIEKDAGFYKCSNCNHCFVPTYKQVLFSMHKGRTRYIKCQKCGKKSWHKKVISNDKETQN